MRRLPLLELVGMLGSVTASAVRADELPRRSKQLTMDVDAASIGFTMAGRLRQSRVLLGGGGGFGVSPILGGHRDRDVSAGLLLERGGEVAAALTFDYLMLRLVKDW